MTQKIVSFPILIYSGHIPLHKKKMTKRKKFLSFESMSYRVSSQMPPQSQKPWNQSKKMLLSFRMYHDAGEETPVPITEKDFAGNIAYRTTSERHYLIAREARKRNMSLSQVIDNFIDKAVTHKNQ